MKAIFSFAAVAAVSFLATGALAQTGGSSSTGLANPPSGTSMGAGIGAGGNSRGTMSGSLPSLSAPPGERLGISPSCSPGSTDPACRDRPARPDAPLACEPGDHECANTSGRTRRNP
jgi:hypothetical protein